MSCPPTVTEPELGLTMPQMMLMSVVLPAPLGPSRAKISPFLISRLTPRSATKPDAYVFVTFSTAMIERVAVGGAADVLGMEGKALSRSFRGGFPFGGRR